IVIVAAGNQGSVGSTPITRHPWVIPVAACDLRGTVLDMSNLGNSIGRHGICAPGKNITSLGTDGKAFTSGGTSAAAPFVTAALALLWSEFPGASATTVKLDMVRSDRSRRARIVPPLLDVESAYTAMLMTY